MSHFCRLCQSYLANEEFTGRGRRMRQCRECRRLPAAEREALLALQEIHSFFARQSRISERNVARLKALAASPDPRVVILAEAVLEVSAIAPGRRKRFSKITSKAPGLWQKLILLGLADEFAPDQLSLLESEEGPFGEDDLIVDLAADAGFDVDWSRKHWEPLQNCLDEADYDEDIPF